MSVPVGVQNRPKGSELGHTVGYVTAIWVEQEDTADAVRFSLEVYNYLGGVLGTLTCLVSLERNTTVGVAQFHLLRDAMQSYWVKQYLLVHIHFAWDTDERDLALVYWLAVLNGYQFPAAATDFFADGYTYVGRGAWMKD